MSVWFVAVLDDEEMVVGGFVTRAPDATHAIAEAILAGAPAGAGYTDAIELSDRRLATFLTFDLDEHMGRLMDGEEAYALARRIRGCCAS